MRSRNESNTARHKKANRHFEFSVPLQDKRKAKAQTDQQLEGFITIGLRLNKESDQRDAETPNLHRPRSGGALEIEDEYYQQLV